MSQGQHALHKVVINDAPEESRYNGSEEWGRHPGNVSDSVPARLGGGKVDSMPEVSTVSSSSGPRPSTNECDSVAITSQHRWHIAFFPLSCRPQFSTRAFFSQKIQEMTRGSDSSHSERLKAVSNWLIKAVSFLLPSRTRKWTRCWATFITKRHLLVSDSV